VNSIRLRRNNRQRVSTVINSNARFGYRPVASFPPTLVWYSMIGFDVLLIFHTFIHPFKILDEFVLVLLMSSNEISPQYLFLLLNVRSDNDPSRVLGRLRNATAFLDNRRTQCSVQVVGEKPRSRPKAGRRFGTDLNFNRSSPCLRFVKRWMQPNFHWRVVPSEK
jgi:hypothetical protein